LFFDLGVSVQAQQLKSISRIGFLSRDLHPSDSRAPAPRNLEAFRQGLRELGYVDGKNITIEYRFADARFERLPALAEELVRLKVDIIVATNSTAARGAKQATSSIPIVIASGNDPIQSGLVNSLARPGGNVTGLTNLTSSFIGKRLELLKEAVPKVFRFAFLDDDESTFSRANLREAQAIAHSLGVRLDLFEVKSSEPDLVGAFRAMVKERIGGFITTAVLGSTLNRKRILELAEQNRLPAIHPNPSWIDDGGLMYYGANLPELYRRAATFVDKILRGVKPAELPVEQPTKFEFWVNLTAAQQIGVNIPATLLARADRVIK
jgi:putative tryptophan/tyrosine transport system substrate-binding protein